MQNDVFGRLGLEPQGQAVGCCGVPDLASTRLSLNACITPCATLGRQQLELTRADFLPCDRSSRTLAGEHEA